MVCSNLLFFLFKQKTAYEMRISDWSSDVCSSDLVDSFISFDIDGSSKDVLSATERMKAHQVSDEVQILGKGFDDSLDYILGAYFFEEGGPELGRATCRARVSRYV